MKKRPKRLTWLAVTLFAIAVSFPFQICWMFEQRPTDVWLIAHQMAPLNWVILGLALGAGYLALRASTMLLALLPILMVIVTYNNWLVAHSGLNASAEAALLGAAALLLFIGYCLSNEVVRLLTHPELRWWLTPERYPVALQLQAQGMRLSTFDVSSTGAFVAVPDPERFKPGSRIEIVLELGSGASKLEASAEVVRQAAARGRYPGGVGIRFDGMSWLDRRRLQSYIADQARSLRAEPRPAQQAPTLH